MSQDILDLIANTTVEELKNASRSELEIINYIDNIDPEKKIKTRIWLYELFMLLIRKLTETKNDIIGNFIDTRTKTQMHCLQTNDEKIFHKLDAIINIIVLNKQDSCKQHVSYLAKIDDNYKRLVGYLSFHYRNIYYFSKLICTLISQQSEIGPEFYIKFTIIDSLILTQLGPVLDFSRLSLTIKPYIMTTKKMVNYHDNFLNNIEFFDKFPEMLILKCIHNMTGINPIFRVSYDNIRYICQFILSYICSKFDINFKHVTYDPLFFYKLMVLYKIADDIGNINFSVTNNEYHGFIKCCANELAGLYAYGRDSIERDKTNDIKYIITCFARFFYAIRKQESGCGYLMAGLKINPIRFINNGGIFTTNLFEIVTVTDKLIGNKYRREINFSIYMELISRFHNITEPILFIE